MGANEKVAATFHPLTKYVCEYCKSEWKHPISAALCCDVLSNELDDEDPPRVVRAYD